MKKLLESSLSVFCRSSIPNNASGFRARTGALLLVTILAGAQMSALADDDTALRLDRSSYERALFNDASSRSWDQTQANAIKFSVQIQTRYIYNTRSNISTGRVTNGFEARRSKFKMSGRLGDPRIRFTFGTAFSRSTGLMVTEDVNARFLLTDDWSIKVGKFRPSVLREQAISSKYQLAAERSLITSAFGQTYNQGIALMFRGKNVRATVSAMDVAVAFTGDRIWEYIFRGEVMLSGKRSEMSDFTSFRDDDPATMIGAGVGYLESDPILVISRNSSTLTWSVDLTAEFGGSSIFVALVGNQVETNGLPDVTQFGALVQGGFFINDKTELFTRFSHGDDQGGKSLNLIEVGINYYVSRHNAKFTIDAGLSLDEVTTTWRSAGAGWRPDTTGQDGQFVIRTQVQVLF